MSDQGAAGDRRERIAAFMRFADMLFLLKAGVAWADIAEKHGFSGDAAGAEAWFREMRARQEAENARRVGRVDR